MQQGAFCIHPNLMFMVRMHTISSSSSASALRSLVLNQTSSLCMFSSLAFMSDLHGSHKHDKVISKICDEESDSGCERAKLLSVCRFLT